MAAPICHNNGAWIENKTDILKSFCNCTAPYSGMYCEDFRKYDYCNYSPANGAKRRSGRKPGARVTNSALAFTYFRIMRCYIAQWHSGIESRPIFWIWTLDGFRCFAHARYQARDWLRKRFCFANVTSEI